VIEMDETRVVIVDHRDFDRLALDVLCQQTPGVIVSASVPSVTDGVCALGREHAVVLIGRQLLRVDGPDSVARLRAAGASRVILVGTRTTDGLRAEAVRVDADGVLERDGDGTSLADVLHGELGAVPRWLADGHSV
jgi:DNA-binding NarL/FixJ family response regulator